MDDFEGWWQVRLQVYQARRIKEAAAMAVFMLGMPALLLAAWAPDRRVRGVRRGVFPIKPLARGAAP